MSEGKAAMPNKHQLRAAKRRSALIESARSLYEKQGLTKTTVQDIASDIGCTRSLFYHYFPDKDAITSAVLDTYIADVLEALEHWNAMRMPGDIENALTSIIKLIRLILFEHDAFRRSLASYENAALYLEFLNRVADKVANYIVNTTVRDYGELHKIKIDHMYETFYILIVGIIGYLRQHPDVDDEVLKDVIVQTLYMDRNAAPGKHNDPQETCKQQE